VPTTWIRIVRYRIAYDPVTNSDNLELNGSYPITSQYPIRSVERQSRGTTSGGIMDYSSSIHDDNPAGASPWGSSPVPSPQHARTSSFPTSSEVPPSPTPYSSNPLRNASYGGDDTTASGSYTRPESSVGTESVTETDSQRPDTAESIRSHPEEQQAFNSQQPQQATDQQKYPTQLRQEPQRYHGTERQAQQPQASQYKLQAKITGLERTGRKDPILRFDVHVSRLALVITNSTSC
jgi:hypothetical protein